MPDDDLSKWKLGAFIPVPFQYWTAQEIRVEPRGDEGGCVAVTIHDPQCYPRQKSTTAVMSLDDAENFATLILYEVKRAKGEL